MVWTELKYSKSKVDSAGEVLISENPSDAEVDGAHSVLDNWRSSHSFPLHIFKKRLKWVSLKVDSKALVVQRLKRGPSIIRKLKRVQTKHMNLSQMQDIGGCRAVLSNVNLVRQLSTEYYEKGVHCDLKHKFKNKKDYIQNPKDDGYRSIHLIYNYYSERTPKYNGFLIEIQIRSRLQHFWATAVETVGYFTNQAIKSNEGEKDWIDFFKLMSSVFAKIEGTTSVKKTPENDYELYLAVKTISDRLRVVEKVKSWANLLELIDNLEKDQSHKSHFYLLELNIDSKELTITPFEKNDEEKANLAYSVAEKKVIQERLNKDVVLVEADTSKELKKAYPNYFLDTNQFLSILIKYLDNPPRH